MAESSPLHEPAAAAGAVFRDEVGRGQAAHFGDARAEYEAARDAAAVFDRWPCGQVKVAGADAVSFLHNLCTNDVRGLDPGHGCEAFLPTAQAKIVAYALVYRVPPAGGRDVLWLDVGPGRGATVQKHLDRYLITEQVELADRTGELAQVHLAGPQAAAVLCRALGTAVPDLAELQHDLMAATAGPRCVVRRHDALGVPGYDVLCPAPAGAALWQALAGAGARPAGQEAYHALRIEAGTPLDGVDVTDAHLPQEVGRTEQTVSFTKGCYIGQETVARIRTYGHVNRSLVGLHLPAGGVAAGARLYRGDQEVGQVTSVAISPRRGLIGLAYVRRGSEQAGTVLAVDAADGKQPAEVVALPFAAGVAAR